MFHWLIFFQNCLNPGQSKVKLDKIEESHSEKEEEKDHLEVAKGQRPKAPRYRGSRSLEKVTEEEEEEQEVEEDEERKVIKILQRPKSLCEGFEGPIPTTNPMMAAIVKRKICWMNKFKFY